MRAVTPHLARHVRYALAMPNTGPIRTISEMMDYRDQLYGIALREVDHEIDFVMTLYLTDWITPAVVEEMARLDFPCAIKYYPPEPGATTGSGAGLPLEQCGDVLRAMEVNGVRLLGHFESVRNNDGVELPHELREGSMVSEVLWKFRDQYPDLLHSFEHASTAKAVEYVKADTSGNTVMTVTPQHSLFIAPDLDHLDTGLKCMPIVKTEEDREAIVAFITTGDARAIAGDDSAPHLHSKKRLPFADAASGCWLPHAIELYATVFDHANALDERFESFMSLNGPTWWGLPLPDEDDTIDIVRKKGQVPEPVLIPGTDDMVTALGWSEDGSKLELEFQVT